MASLETQFIGVRKKIRQMAVTKMQAKMERAANKSIKSADKLRDYWDVTGNLYKSTAIGVYYNGLLQSIHNTPGPEPTRLTLAKGERYDQDRYYGDDSPLHSIANFKGLYGEGGQDGPSTAEDILYYGEHNKGKYENTWNFLLVAGVDYAQFVQVKRGHDVISSLRDYMVRYFKSV